MKEEHKTEIKVCIGFILGISIWAIIPCLGWKYLNDRNPKKDYSKTPKWALPNNKGAL